MFNIVANLYEDGKGQFWKLIDAYDELIDYCEENDDIDTHEDIQELYEKLGIEEYLDEHRATKIYHLKAIDRQIDALRDTN